MDGSSGQLLWNLPTPDEIFTSAVFNDINNDNVADVLLEEEMLNYMLLMDQMGLFYGNFSHKR